MRGCPDADEVTSCFTADPHVVTKALTQIRCCITPCFESNCICNGTAQSQLLTSESDSAHTQTNHRNDRGERHSELGRDAPPVISKQSTKSVSYISRRC